MVLLSHAYRNIGCKKFREVVSLCEGVVHKLRAGQGWTILLVLESGGVASFIFIERD